MQRAHEPMRWSHKVLPLGVSQTTGAWAASLKVWRYKEFSALWKEGVLCFKGFSALKRVFCALEGFPWRDSEHKGGGLRC